MGAIRTKQKAGADRIHPGLAGGQGFEPRLTDPKSVVLPLDDPPLNTRPARADQSAGVKWCRDPDLNWGHQHFQCCALPTELSRQKDRHNGRPFESGRRDSNSRPSPWQGDVLPLNYARKVFNCFTSTELKFTSPARNSQILSLLFLTFLLRSHSSHSDSSLRVDPVGFEPTISCLQSRRLPAWPRAQNLPHSTSQ